MGRGCPHDLCCRLSLESKQQGGGTMMRRDHHKTGLNYNNQRHYLVKMMSIISLVFLLAHTILSPIGQHVLAEESEEVKVHGVKLENPNDIERIEATIIYKETGVEKERFPMSKDNGNKLHGYTINDKSAVGRNWLTAL